MLIRFNQIHLTVENDPHFIVKGQKVPLTPADAARLVVLNDIFIPHQSVCALRWINQGRDEGTFGCHQVKTPGSLLQHM